MIIQGLRNDIIMGILNLTESEKYSCDIKPLQGKRSQNANSFYWTLLSKLSVRTKIANDEIHLKMLRKYGTYTTISIKSDVDIGNFVKYYEKIGESELNGKLFCHYRIFKETSSYSVEEMKTLINGLVSECKYYGIETYTNDDMERLNQLWSRNSQ